MGVLNLTLFICQIIVLLLLLNFFRALTIPLRSGLNPSFIGAVNEPRKA